MKARRVRQIATGALVGFLLPLLALYGCKQVANVERDVSAVGIVTSERAYLYDTIIFEIAPVASCTPDLDALAYFRSKIEDYGICQEKGVLFLVQHEETQVQPFPLTLWYIQYFERVHRLLADAKESKRSCVVFISYMAGPILLEGRGLMMLGGIQYGKTSFTIFKDGAGMQEGAVLMHEFGHVLGIRKKNKDPLYHCPNKSCIMWTSVASPYSRLCTDCLADLADIIKASREES